MLTTTLPRFPQFVFLAKNHVIPGVTTGCVLAKTFANKTQAAKAATQAGPEWSVFKTPLSRPFYVVKSIPVLAN